jgi:hypothetical protein
VSDTRTATVGRGGLGSGGDDLQARSRLRSCSPPGRRRRDRRRCARGAPGACASRGLGRDHGRLVLLPLTLGNVERDLALELGPPARVVAAASMSRSIRPTASRSTPPSLPGCPGSLSSPSPPCVQRWTVTVITTMLTTITAPPVNIVQPGARNASNTAVRSHAHANAKVAITVARAATLLDSRQPPPAPAGSRHRRTPPTDRGRGHSCRSASDPARQPPLLSARKPSSNGSDHSWGRYSSLSRGPHRGCYDWSCAGSRTRSSLASSATVVSGEHLRPATRSAAVGGLGTGTASHAGDRLRRTRPGDTPPPLECPLRRRLG